MFLIIFQLFNFIGSICVQDYDHCITLISIAFYKYFLLKPVNKDYSLIHFYIMIHYGLFPFNFCIQQFCLEQDIHLSNDPFLSIQRLPWWTLFNPHQFSCSDQHSRIPGVHTDPTLKSNHTGRWNNVVKTLNTYESKYWSKQQLFSGNKKH